MNSAAQISAAESPDGETRVIQARRGMIPVDLGELWRFRELFWLLSRRNVALRYKQTYLGVGWAVLQPFLTTVVFTVIFGRIGKFPTKGAPYPVLILAGLLPWQFFANALSESSNALIISQSMISKIYFPRLVLPASVVFSGMVDFLISVGLLFMVMLWYHVPLTAGLLMMPFFFLVSLLASLGMGFWFSALNVKYRDVKYIVPFIVRMGFFISPVAFLSDTIPVKWQFLYGMFNPLVGAIDGFRWCVLGPKFEPSWPGFWSGCVVTVLVFISGALYFSNTERKFADII